MRFYLGTHHPDWLRKTDVPLFISRRRLTGRKTFPTALGPWALDSGGFTEVSMFGGWQTTPEEYVADVRRFSGEIGNMEWAAPMDWMCEPYILEQTGLSVQEHQRRTTENLIELRTLAPELSFIPVLQGWEYGDYIDHMGMYEAAGVDLPSEPLVGVGSVCRRQDTISAHAIVVTLAALGLRLHGFGIKIAGLAKYGLALASADSMAWSYGARRSEPLPGHTHKTCANCLPFAMRWRDRIVE